MLAGLDPQRISLDFAKRFGTTSCAKTLCTEENRCRFGPQQQILRRLFFSIFLDVRNN